MKIRKKLFIFFNFLILSLIYGQSISFNEEFQVNTNAYGWQYSPAAYGLKNGNFVVCWVSEPGDGSGSGIFAQIFTSEGEKIANEFLVNTDTVDYQRSPSICGLSSGKFIISWTSYLLDGSSNVSLQIFNEDGSKFGSELRINTNNEEYQSSSTVSGINNGGFIICWESNRKDGNGSGIFAQIFSQQGIKVSDEVTVSNNLYDQNLNCSVSTLSNGDIVICWRSYNITDSGQGIFAQILNENGIKIGSEFKVNTLANGWLRYPNISALSNEGFIISWTFQPYGGGDGAEITAQLFNNSGIKNGAEFQVNTYKKDFQEISNICNMVNGKFIISWQSKYQDGDLTGIYSQMFDEGANKIGTEFQVNDFVDGFQSGVSSSSIGSEKFILCWTSESDQDGSGAGIFAKIYPNEPYYHQLKNFELVAPDDNKTIEINNVNFNWNSTTGSKIIFPWELTYNLYIDSAESFTNPIVLSGIEDTTYQIDSLEPDETYFWKVLAKNYYGDSLWSSNVSKFYIEPNTTVVEDISLEIPTNFNLHQNYPNPFNPTTKIKYSIPDVGNENILSVQLKIYNVLGKEIKTLVNKEQSTGNYEVEFYATNSNGDMLPSGIYFYKLQAGKYTKTKKMVLLR